MATRFAGFAAVLLLCLGFVALGRGEVVYDNLTAPISAFTGVTLEMGDEVTLGGTARHLTSFTLPLTTSALEPGTAQLAFRLYANTAQGGWPGITLYSTSAFTVTYAPGVTQLNTLALPEVLVPDTFTWTIRPLSSTGELPDLQWYDPPTVGSSADFTWQRWVNEWRRVDALDPQVDNFGGRFEAVPEPGAALALALAVLIWRRARRG